MGETSTTGRPATTHVADGALPAPARHDPAGAPHAGVPVALAHDYATQRGGAERVALLMAEAFPSAPLYTTLYHPPTTYPEFASLDLRTSVLNGVGAFRRNHRLALPWLAPVVSAQRVEADVLLASSSGWAHGYRGARRTVVYCYIPARWLYQTDRYLGPVDPRLGARARRRAMQASVTALGPALRAWDARAAHRADRYLVCSTGARAAVEQTYGIESEVLSPPPAMLPGGPERQPEGVEPGFLLSVARLLPYKNVDLVVEAAQRLDGPELVVVGSGPDLPRIQELAARSGRVRVLGRVSDEELRWLYRNASALVAASYEDFGLSPLEANSFGVPAVAWRSGGYLDSVVDGETGTFFDELTPQAIADAVDRSSRTTWSAPTLEARAELFSQARFVARLHEIVAAEAQSS